MSMAVDNFEDLKQRTTAKTLWKARCDATGLWAQYVHLREQIKKKRKEREGPDCDEFPCIIEASIRFFDQLSGLEAKMSLPSEANPFAEWVEAAGDEGVSPLSGAATVSGTEEVHETEAAERFQDSLEGMDDLEAEWVRCEWVYEKMHVTVTVEDAPDSKAWTLLHIARKNEVNFLNYRTGIQKRRREKVTNVQSDGTETLEKVEQCLREAGEDVEHIQQTRTVFERIKEDRADHR